MTNYPFKMQLVVDPDNPRNVVAGGSVSIYDADDTALTTPLALTDPNGVPITNPIVSNANGFTEPFVTTSPQVLWVSGEYRDYFESYQGMRDEAVAAKVAAEAAEAAATAAGANAAAEANAALSSAVADAETAAAAAEFSASLVGAPADTAIATAVAAVGSASKAAIAAEFAPKAAKGLSSPTDAPNFVKHGTAQLTQANSGLASIYWPYVVNVEHITGHLGNFYMYYSTDHDLGAGGVKMAYADSPTGPWTRHPTFSYVDAVAGDQTETPSVIWNEDTNKFHMYYQQEGTGLNQSTFLATSPDGLVWTRIGMVIQGITNIPGDGQTTYLRPFRAGGQWIGYHLFGGGNYGHGGISYSQDGITWVTDPRRLGFFNDLIGDVTQRIDLFHAVPFEWRGHVWALAQMGPHIGGFVEGGAKWVLGRLSPDFRSFVGKPKQIFATLPGAETETNGPTSVIAYGNSIYTYYRANGAQGDFRVAVAEA